MKSKTLIYSPLLASMAISLIGCKETAINAVRASKPNIIYIFPDQYRMHAMSIWSDPEYRKLLTTNSDPVSTPNIDRLAREGVLFTQATSTHPVSSPMRAMLMSGMYPHNNGVYDLNCRLDRKQELHHDIVCFTDVLSQQGYETAYIGKTHWHKTERLFDEKGDYQGKESGYHVGPFDTYIPEGRSRHGNKFWFQQLNDNHFNAIVYSNRPELIEGKTDGQQYRPKQFTTTVEADVIIKFLDNKNNERVEGKPFSVIWSINPPHPPYSRVADCHEDIYNEMYKDLPLSELLNRQNFVAGSTSNDHSYTQAQKVEKNARIYFSLIKAVDNEIGRVLAKLEEIGQEDNTIIVFTSDHGEMMGSHGLTGKNSIHDESFLVPYIIRYPGVIKPKSTSDLLIGTVDQMPTLLSMMGLAEYIPETAQGRDYAQGIVTGEYTEAAKPQSALYIRQDLRGVRTDRYSYVISENGTYEIYDNQIDPYQQQSLTFDQISDQDGAMLKEQLGWWLSNEGTDKWFTNKVDASLVTYPPL